MLTTEEIENAQFKEKPYKLYDEQGLYVLVKPNGSKLYRIKYFYHGKEKVYSLGATNYITLEDARNYVKNLKMDLSRNKDPQIIKKAKQTMSIKEPIKILRVQLKSFEEMRDKLDYKKRQLEDDLENILMDLNDILITIEEMKTSIKLLEEYLS